MKVTIKKEKVKTKTLPREVCQSRFHVDRGKVRSTLIDDPTRDEEKRDGSLTDEENRETTLLRRSYRRSKYSPIKTIVVLRTSLKKVGRRRRRVWRVSRDDVDNCPTVDVCCSWKRNATRFRGRARFVSRGKYIETSRGEAGACCQLASGSAVRMENAARVPLPGARRRSAAATTTS